MSRAPTAAPDALFAHLRRHGRQPAGALVSALGISRPTLARAVADEASVVRIGKARATEYALAGDIRGQWRWPLYRIDASAQVQELGTLCALQRDETLLAAEHPREVLWRSPLRPGLFPDLPWFLDDLRPSGFLGRSYAHHVASRLRVPADLTVWNAEHVLVALLHGGSSQAGDLVLGDVALAAALHGIAHPGDAVDERERATAYPRMALDVLQGGSPGSSPGGEQPKFTATLQHGADRRQVIVKFSPDDTSPAARRWADLLRCEAHAAEVLEAQGLAAAVPRIVEAGGRVFLESPRFDRTPCGGRLGFVSLASIEAAFRGEGPAPWWQLADWLQADGWLHAEDATRLRRLSWFGELIANSDMHLANAALILGDTAPLRLAPAWDMLPMRLRPDTQGNLVQRTFQPAPPTAGQHEDWRWAAEAAREFWVRVMNDAALDVAVHRFAQDAHGTLGRLATHFQKT